MSPRNARTTKRPAGRVVAPSAGRGQVVSASQARESFADLVNRAAYGGERIPIRRHGKTVAALVPLEDLELLEFLEDRIDIEGALQAEAEPGENISLSALRAKLGL